MYYSIIPFTLNVISIFVLLWGLFLGYFVFNWFSASFLIFLFCWYIIAQASLGIHGAKK